MKCVHTDIYRNVDRSWSVCTLSQRALSTKTANGLAVQQTDKEATSKSCVVILGQTMMSSDNAKQNQDKDCAGLVCVSAHASSHECLWGKNGGDNRKYGALFHCRFQNGLPPDYIRIETEQSKCNRVQRIGHVFDRPFSIFYICTENHKP